MLRKKMISWVKAYLLILLIIFPSFFFNQALFSYFSQDDFYHLRQVMDKNIYSLPAMFVPGGNTEQTFYRPLGREFYNFAMINIFGVQPLPYHLANLLLIVVNGLLMYKFIKFFSLKKAALIIALVLYFTSAIHSVELYYLSSVQTLIATVFVLSGIILYKNFLGKKDYKTYFLSLILFAAAILSHESAATFVPIIALLEVFSWKRPERAQVITIAYHLAPFAVILGMRILVYFYLVGLPNQAVYKPVFYPASIFNGLVWFTLWCFGLPEMLVDFVTLKFQINPNLFNWYGSYVKLVFSSLVLIFAIILYLLLVFKNSLIRQKPLYLFLICFFISLVPFLFFPQHKFVYYLTFPIIWFSMALGTLLSFGWRRGSKTKLLVVIMLFFYIFISYKTVEVNEITYWAAKRARAAQFLVSDIMSKHPKVEDETTFYFKNDPNYPQISEEWGSSSKQAFYILSGSDALQLNYRDTTIKVMYGDINALPKGQDKLIMYTAKFPY